jgi:uncharacterized protein RhaS with RHS repeats
LAGRKCDRGGASTQEDPIGVAGGINLYQFNGNDPASYTDPFGLCPDPKDPACPKHGSGKVGFVGVTVNAVFGTGVVAGAGVYTTSEGFGTYAKLGFGVGLDVSIGGEVGTSESLAKFSGPGEAGCGGAFVANGCAGNSPGEPDAATKSGGLAAGPTEALSVSGHAERTHTWVSAPVAAPKGNCGESYCPTWVK